MRSVLLVVVAALGLLVPGRPLLAQKQNAGGPADYVSPHFLLHTDLPPGDAKELLQRLEQMLGLISAYWDRPSSGVIECYVVQDLARWPADVIPAEGRAKIAEGAGVTISQRISSGDKFLAKAVVYAVADRGTPQHEAVHAYCAQTFGQTGPTWYSEGMAEMGQYWRKDNADVKIHDEVLEYLKTSPPLPLSRLVAQDQVTGDSWQNYAWRWALCHLLANNPNYADRFRPLGIGLLTGQPVSFELTYGAMANEISFEYLFFLSHLEQGLRAELIAWDWSKKFLPLKTAQKTFSAQVQARRGWQPSGLTVEAGVEYRLKTSGSWKLSRNGEPTTAGGGPEDAGRLEGIVLSDWKLGEPFFLGAEGSFVPPTSGDLYLRCHEGWADLEDNSGRISVKLSYIGPDASPSAGVFRPTANDDSASPSGGKTAGQPTSGPAAAFRTWKDNSGAFQIEAQLAGRTTEAVQLRRRDGRTVTVPINRLSDQDRDFLEALPANENR